MAFDYAKLTEITTVTTSAAAVFTNPASKTSYPRLIQMHNGHTDAQYCILYNVPDVAAAVGTAGTTNEIFKKILDVDETVWLEYPVPGMILSDQNDTIQAECQTGNTLTIEIYGGQE